MNVGKIISFSGRFIPRLHNLPQIQPKNLKTNDTHIHRLIGVLLVFLFLSHTLSAQQKLPPIRLKNGVINRDQNITRIDLDSLHTVLYRKNYYVLLQFDHLPGGNERAGLRAKGVRLFDYLPGGAYLAEIREDATLTGLQSEGISGLTRLSPALKISPRLNNPEAYTREEGQLIAASFFGSLSKDEAGKALEAAGASLVKTRIVPPNVLFFRAGPAALQRIAALPFISYIGPQSMKDQPLNYNNRASHGVDALSNDPARNLQGDGVTVGVGDDATPWSHVDLTGRVIDRFGPQNIDAHGIHVSGSVAGGGILNPLYKGMAPHATLISQYFSDILVNADAYVPDFGMVLTSNSYTAYNPGCLWEGEYDFLSYYTDLQMTTYPSLLHVFASGNDGGSTCSPYTRPYGTVKSGYQSAKNVLTVGNMDNTIDNAINGGSSSGPVGDGRLKPEIVAGGTGILSTWTNNNYGVLSGTSQACPTVSGALALLIQRYRQLHGGANPSAALVKALACNTATDMGNPGPDFLYGFGSLNIKAAVEALETGRFIEASITNGNNNTYTLTGIPAGLRQLKVLLYWPDVAAMPGAGISLVNDLDLIVTSPDATVHQPMILNPGAGHTADQAVEGADHLNNIEQVVIDNPPGGSFTVTVKGTSLPAGAQRFIVAYEPVQPSVVLMHPSGSETLVPGATETIRWIAFGGETNPFSLEYSPDNGSSWSLISNTIPATQRLYTWTVPATATSQALIRVRRNSTSYTDVSSRNFTILGQPVIAISNPCQGYAQLNWTAVPSAVSYDIFQLKGDTMKKVGSTAGTSFLLGSLRRDSACWLAVSAVINGVNGRRSLAAQVTPSGGACSLAALDNDLTVDSLIGPSSGRKFTGKELSSTETIRVELRNLGTIAAGSPISLSYRINGGAVVTESAAITVGAGAVYAYSFSAKADLSAIGAYTIQAWVSYPGDPQNGNDTVTRTVKQLQNDPIVLNPSFTEGFETAAVADYLRPVQGLTGLDRGDFSRSNTNGRMRTFLNTGFARTGSRSAILDQVHYSAATTTDSLITTFNLSGYTASDQIWLNFYYRNQGIDSVFPGNMVWIRGNDQAAWISVYALDASFGKIGVYQPSANIDVTGILKAATPSQTVSSSFQVKFGEQGHTSANSIVTDGNLDDGYSFDDITLTKATGDVSTLALTAPLITNLCHFGNAEPISVSVKNFSSVAASNIPVSYSVNGITVTEHIPAIGANDSLIYTFTKKADLSAYRSYSLRAWVSATGDTYAANDSLPVLSFQTVPLVSSFPYLEGFEKDDGHWYAGGTNSSWQWGTPAKSTINKAANGTRCWTTSLTGNYNDNELSYLYSPCFDLSTLANPVLSFSHIFQTEDNCLCDFHWVEYSTDGITWARLGASTSGVNWYDNAPRQAWQKSDERWHVSSYNIPTNTSSVRFRIVMSSDPATNYEGVAIDDIRIFDKAAIYSGVDTTKTIAVSGDAWINFDIGGQRILSLQPHGQDLGDVKVQLFINSGGVRNDGVQYYLDRNIVIQPSRPPTDKVSVRCYFLDSEVKGLLAAANCPSCSKLPDAYESGVTQYSSPVLTEEDSSLANNATGLYHFLLPRQDITVIPYDNGYFAEYDVSGFSEFWINAGGPGYLQAGGPLLLSFTATRSGDRGLLQWTTDKETNASRYIIEKSLDGTSFAALDSVAARNGDTVNTYHFADNALRNGTNSYRLKMLDMEGHYNYSPVRTLDMDGSGFQVHIFPNPYHSGELHITSSVNIRQVGLADVSGRIILRTAANVNNYTLIPGRLARGMYFLILDTEGGRKVEKLLVK